MPSDDTREHPKSIEGAGWHSHREHRGARSKSRVNSVAWLTLTPMPVASGHRAFGGSRIQGCIRLVARLSYRTNSQGTGCPALRAACVSLGRGVGVGVGGLAAAVRGPMVVDGGPMVIRRGPTVAVGGPMVTGGGPMVAVRGPMVTARGPTAAVGGRVCAVADHESPSPTPPTASHTAAPRDEMVETALVRRC